MDSISFLGGLMHVYEFVADSDRFPAFLSRNRRDQKTLDLLFEGRPLAERWQPIRIKTDGVEGVQPDFACFDASFPAFSRRAWDATKGLIGSSAEALPIVHPSGQAFFAVNVTRVVDALEEARCQFVRYSSGKVMRIAKHVFRPEVISEHPVFRVPQIVENVYYTDSFLKIVRELGLTGLYVHPLR